MSAIYSLPKLEIIGADVCEKCYRRDELTRIRSVQTRSESKVCMDCVVKNINDQISAGDFPLLNIEGKKVAVGFVKRGERAGELVAFERLERGS